MYKQLIDQAKKVQGHVQGWNVLSEKANVNQLILDVANTYCMISGLTNNHLRHQYIVSRLVICSVVGGWTSNWWKAVAKAGENQNKNSNFHPRLLPDRTHRHFQKYSRCIGACEWLKCSDSYFFRRTNWISDNNKSMVSGFPERNSESDPESAARPSPCLLGLPQASTGVHVTSGIGFLKWMLSADCVRWRRNDLYPTDKHSLRHSGTHGRLASDKRVSGCLFWNWLQEMNHCSIALGKRTQDDLLYINQKGTGGKKLIGWRNIYLLWCRSNIYLSWWSFQRTKTFS